MRDILKETLITTQRKEQEASSGHVQELSHIYWRQTGLKPKHLLVGHNQVQDGVIYRPAVGKQ